MTRGDWLGVIGIAATLLIFIVQFKMNEKIKNIEDKVKSGKWEVAKNVFYLNCFIVSGDLLRAILSYTAKIDGKIYICEDMEYPLHEIFNRFNNIYNQSRTLSPALGDGPSAELSNALNILHFSANAAGGSLRCWDEIEDLLPIHRSVESNHDEYVVFVGPNRRPNLRRKPELMGKNFDGFAVNLYECTVRLLISCEELYRISIDQTNGQELGNLFPPTWAGISTDGKAEDFTSFKERIKVNLKTLEERIKCMEESGICLVKYSVNRQHL